MMSLLETALLSLKLSHSKHALSLDNVDALTKVRAEDCG